MVLAAIPACKSKGQDTAPEGGPLADNPVPHLITKDQCSTWSAHGVEVVFNDWKAAANACPLDAQKQLADRLDGQRPSVEQAALSVCTSHLGQMYVPGDASCYMAAGTAKALLDCKFAPLTNPGDSDIVGEIGRLRANCMTGRPPTAPPPRAPGSPI
jgi:hypothetical protein